MPVRTKKSSKDPVSQKLKNTGYKPPKDRPPVWKGPEVDGVTQSLLSRFIVCPERFRLLVIEGLTPQDTFNHRLEYGNLFHLAEETYLQGGDWKRALKEYATVLCLKYRMQQEQVQHWLRVCQQQFPTYIKYWEKHRSKLKYKPVVQELVFAVPYTLPCQKVVILRGKFDSVNLVGKDLFLQENKTKADVDQMEINRQLKYDLQTMLYLIALQTMRERRKDLPKELKAVEKSLLKGVMYNVVRRPLSGGKHTIKQCKGESVNEYYDRLGGLIAEEPDHYFMRWKMDVSQKDIDRFRERTLDPLLLKLCYWYNEVSFCHERKEVLYTSNNYQTPFGIYNPLAEGGSTDLDNYLLTGSEVGLQRTKNLFPELVEE